MPNDSYAVFCDFDGTVARRDVGYHMYHHFSGGRNDDLLPDWKSGRMSTRDCLLAESKMVTMTPDEFYAFLDDFELDAGFPDFLDACRENDLPLTVISDGLDLYINYLLKKYDIPPVPIISNRAQLVNNSLQIEFPYPDPNETGGGVCKGERIAEYREKVDGDVTVIFAGDGLSDVSALDQVDWLFAKKDLKQYCDRHEIEYTPFDTFHDVTAELKRRKIITR